MKITANKTSANTFRIAFGDTHIALDARQLKKLLAEIVGVIAPDIGVRANPRETFNALCATLKAASAVGVQKFILSAEDEDILILLKMGEDDASLIETLYANMSARARKMYEEDLSFRFTEGVPKADMRRAMENLSQLNQKLHDDGILDATASEA